MGHIDRRELVEAILLRSDIPVLNDNEQRSGIAVSPNGRIVRVSLREPTADRLPDAEIAVLKAWLALAAAVLRAGDIPVVVTVNGMEARLGAAPPLPVEAAEVA